VILREDSEEARREARRFVRTQKKPLIEAENPHAGDDYGLAELEHTLEHEFDDYVDDRTILAGTPDECIEQVEHVREATGCDEIICRVSTIGWDHKKAMETIDLLGEKVLPSF